MDEIVVAPRYPSVVKANAESSAKRASSRGTVPPPAPTSPFQSHIGAAESSTAAMKRAKAPRQTNTQGGPNARPKSNSGLKLSRSDNEKAKASHNVRAESASTWTAPTKRARLSTGLYKEKDPNASFVDDLESVSEGDEERLNEVSVKQEKGSNGKRKAPLKAKSVDASRTNARNTKGQSIRHVRPSPFNASGADL
jgi:hypothetical protein